MLTDVQKRTAQAIINVFETGKPGGDYASVVYHPNDPGQLTYGRSQTTLASGNLALLIAAYCRADGAAFAEQLRPYLTRLDHRDTALNTDMTLRGILREAGRDAVMQATQDAFFDRVYWASAATIAAAAGIVTALGTAIVYDSIVHGSWALIRDVVTGQHGAPKTIGEKVWVKHYVDARRKWLARHSNTLLRTTVYRMDTFLDLIGADNWKLEPPFRAHGTLIDASDVSGTRVVVVSAEVIETRMLRLRQPFLNGDDVRQLQTALAKAGHKVKVDGVFGPTTDTAVRALQKKKGLVVDGIVGTATRAALGIV